MTRTAPDPRACLHCKQINGTPTWTRDGVDGLGRVWYRTVCPRCGTVTRKPTVPLSPYYPVRGEGR